MTAMSIGAVKARFTLLLINEPIPKAKTERDRINGSLVIIVRKYS